MTKRDFLVGIFSVAILCGLALWWGLCNPGRVPENHLFDHNVLIVDTNYSAYTNVNFIIGDGITNIGSTSLDARCKLLLDAIETGWWLRERGWTMEQTISNSVKLLKNINTEPEPVRTWSLVISNSTGSTQTVTLPIQILPGSTSTFIITNK